MRRYLCTTCHDLAMSEVEERLLELPVMDIQPNWNETFRDSDDKVWISCRGAKTTQTHICRPTGREPSDNQFVIRDYKLNSVTIECPEVGLTTTFVSPRKTLRLHDGKLLCGDVSESGGLGVCSAEDGSLWIWDPVNGETRRTLKGHVGDVYTCKFFPSGIVVLSGGADLQLKIWSAQDGSCPRTLTGHKRGITDTAIIDRGRNIVSVSSDGSAKLWDCGSGSCLADLVSTQCPINACALSTSATMAEKNTTEPPEPECGTSDKLLLLGCEDGSLRCIDVRNRETVFAFSVGASILSCAFIGEVQVASGSEVGVHDLLDIRNPQKVLSKFSCGSSAVTSLIQVGNGKCLSGYADGTCLVWNTDVTNKRCVAKLTGPELDRITSVCKAVGCVYTTNRDGNVRMYNIADFTL